MRLIFVPVADRPECAKALRTGFELANKLEASVCGCHIRPHTGSEVTLPPDFGWLVGQGAAAGEAVLKTKQSSSPAAKALFAKAAERHGYSLITKPRAKPGAVWLEKVGSPDKILSIWGPVSDLLVVSRPAPRGGKLARFFLMAALFNTSRPVLVLPQSGKPTSCKRISIAWNQSGEAARTVAAAMPLLQAADEVNILTSGPEQSLGPKSMQLANYLRYWGVSARRVKTKGSDDADALLSGYRDTESDLLVMGAYSRSRLRERVFGGVTDYMLNRANIPVLTLHT